MPNVHREPLKPAKGILNGQKHETDLTFSRGEAQPDSKRSYAGVLFTNTFKVDKPIVLLGVSFFGPHKSCKEERICYTVTLALHEGLVFKKRSKILLKPTRIPKVAVKGEKFRVNLPQMIILKPNTWYDIQFELNGPETEHMDLKKVQNQCTFWHESGENSKRVTFDSFVGSCQMPDFHFLLA